MQPAPSEEWQFPTVRVGRRVLVFDELPSTNTTAAELAKADADTDGLVIVARHQTAGRGRLGRVWQSAPDSSLLVSVIVSPPPELRRPSVLTAWAATAVGGAIYSLTGLQARIKWPNDLLIRGKKVCGILIEQGQVSGTDGPRAYIVAGVGLNLNQPAEDFAAADLPDATSLALCGGKPVSLRAAAEAVVTHLDAEYDRLVSGERAAVEADWKWRTGLLGRQVRVEFTDGSSLGGRLRDLGFDGLELESDTGSVRVLVPETVAQIRTI